jgi:hypothetical protein
MRVFFGLLSLVLLSVAGFAQDNQGSWMGDISDKYVISAKAGGVNFVEGKVTVVANDGTGGRLMKGDRLEARDIVTTGADGKAEILLNPGSYARLGVNTKFEFVTTSLDELELNVSSGSAVFEVFASKDFKVTINTPKAKMFLIQSGIYRVDVLGDGSGKVSVTKGRAQLDDSTATVIKSGNQATLNGHASQVAKFDSDNKDELETWSKARAKQLAEISRRVETASMRNSLLNSFGARRWNMFGSFGLWTYDPFWGSYAFLPFGYGWNSPYGYGFGPCIYTYHLPPVVYIPPVHNPGNGNNGNTGQNTPLGNNPRGGIRPPLSGAPPFVRIQADPKSGGSITNGGGVRAITDTRTDINTSSPVYSPAPMPVFVPSTTRGESTKPKGN